MFHVQGIDMTRPYFKWIGFWAVLGAVLAVATAHPFKASVCEIKYNQRNHHLEISLKLFTDDLEECIEAETGTMLFLDTPREISDAGALIDNYVQERMRIRSAGGEVELELEYLGKEHDLGVTWCYFESEAIEFPRQLYIFNSIMSEMYPTQSNIVHIQAGEAQRSLLLGPGRKTGEVEFER